MKPVRVWMDQRSPDWHDFRSKGLLTNPYPCVIGASEVGRLLDVRGGGAIELWKEKLGTQKVFSAEEQKVMDMGTEAEPEIAERLWMETGVALVPAVFTLDEASWLVASLDGYSPELIGEYKLAGMRNFEAAREAPLVGHVAQVVTQMLCSGVHVAKIAYMQMWSHEFIVHDVPWDEGLAERILKITERFCQHVAYGTAPWQELKAGY